MPITKTTDSMTEAELEARLREVLKVIFPWIKSEEITHQTTFKFKFGTSYVEVKGKNVSEAQGRLDILICRNDKPLAVIELKRPSAQLKTEDESQGLSYARMHNPMPPLVIVSNGKDYKVLLTYTGEQWQPSSRSELELEKKINAMGNLALSELKSAIEVLLGPNSDFWIEVVKKASKISISEQLGYLSDNNSTFNKDFIIPRDATDQLLKDISNTKKITILHGSPLIGKSNVLFDFISRTEASNDYVVLYVEADNGEGICQYIASLFSDELEIEFSRDSVLSWLKKLSNSQGKKLILAIDGVNSEKSDIQKDIEILVKNQYGSNLKIVITCDDVIAEKLIKKGNKPKPSNIGRFAQKIHVDKLSNIEFNRMQKILLEKGLCFMAGADRSPEYRLPHIIKAVLNSTLLGSINTQDNSLLVIPSLLGPTLLVECRKIYEDTHYSRHLYQDIVKVIITEYLDKQRSPSLILNSMYTFSIRRKQFLVSFNHSILNDLVENELIKIGYTSDNESILIITLPELFASEVAYYLSRQLVEKLSISSQEAYTYLLTMTSPLPFGDLIAALAICDAENSIGLPIELYKKLLSDKPTYQYPQPGTKLALMVPTPKGKVQGEIIIQDENHALFKVGNIQNLIEIEDFKSELKAIANYECWLILSHLANNQKILKKLIKSNVDILTEVGNCSMMLRKYSENIEENGYEFHELADGSAVSCSKNGIIEPITLAIFNFFGNSKIQASKWLKRIDLKKSIHLKARVWIVLNLISASSNEPISNWAKEELSKLN
jgi:hypothetical protein